MTSYNTPCHRSILCLLNLIGTCVVKILPTTYKLINNQHSIQHDISWWKQERQL